MNKIGFIAILILIIAVLGTSGCILNNNAINDNSTKNYTGYNVSFNFPGNWMVVSDNTTGIRTIMVHKNSNSTFNPVQLTIQLMVNSGMSEEGAINSFQNQQTPGWTKLSNDTLTIDGKTAYRSIYSVNDTHFGELMRIHQIVFVKNDTTYVMLLQAPDKDFDNEKPIFDMIINSFKVG